MPVGHVAALGAGRPGAVSCGGHWQVVPSADVGRSFGDFNSLDSVAVFSPTLAWAVGEYDRFKSNSYYHTLAERWDGAAWSVVPTQDSAQPNNVLSGVAVSDANNAWAVGYERQSSGNYYTLIEHWDGKAWSIVQNGTYLGWLRGVTALSASDVWAVGSTNYVGHGLIEHWDGQRWTRLLLHGAEFLNAVVALSPTDVWAVGFKSTARGSGEGDDTFTEHYDGTKWTHVPSPSPLKLHNIDQNWLTSVTASSSSDVWAVGVTRDTDYGILDATLTEHWDGSRWKVVRSPDPGGKSMYNDFWGVATIHANDVWTVGSVGEITFAPLAAQWNGSRWSAVKTPALQGVLQSAGYDASSRLWAVGNRVRNAGGKNVYNGTLVESLCPA